MTRPRRSGPLPFVFRSIAVVAVAATACLAPAATGAATYYVCQAAPGASDANPGTRERPFKTLGKACAVATAGDTVYIRQGVYREALIPKHSGERGRPIVFQTLFSIDWGGAGNKLCRTNGNTVRNLVSAFNFGSGLWHDIDCTKTVVEDCLSFGNRPVNAGFFYEISREGVFRRNVSFANYGRGGEFYGCGFVLSASDRTVVEENVVIGGSGGVALGNERDAHLTVGNTIQRNLVVEPELAALCVVRGKHDPTAPGAGNRFLENTFLVSGADSRLAFGSRRLANAGALDAEAAGARGNRSASNLTQLDKGAARRLNDALKRVLDALRVADARLNLRVPSISLEAIWRLGGPGKATGYWLKAGKERYLLLDVASPGEVRLTGSGTPVLWDFPVLRAPVREPLARVGDTLMARVEGPCALIAGLGSDARPAAAADRSAAASLLAGKLARRVGPPLISRA